MKHSWFPAESIEGFHQKMAVIWSPKLRGETYSWLWFSTQFNIIFFDNIICPLNSEAKHESAHVNARNKLMETKWVVKYKTIKVIITFFFNAQTVCIVKTIAFIRLINPVSQHSHSSSPDGLLKFLTPWSRTYIFQKKSYSWPVTCSLEERCEPLSRS